MDLASYDRRMYPVMLWSECKARFTHVNRLKSEIKRKKTDPKYRNINTRTIIGIRQAICLGSLGLVFMVMNQLRGSGVPLDDMISQGNETLLMAIENFSLRGKARWSTYAMSCIRFRMLTLIRDHRSRLTKSIHDRLALIKRAAKALENGSLPTPQEIAEYIRKNHGIKMTIDYIAHYLVVDEGQRIHYDNIFVEDRNTDDLVDARRIKELARLWLTERAYTILKHRFGLDGVPPESLQQIATRLRLTHERIRQIEDKCLHILKHIVKHGKAPRFSPGYLTLQQYVNPAMIAKYKA